MRNVQVPALLVLALAFPAMAADPPPKLEVVERVAPLYPTTLRKQGIAGRVVVWAYVDAEGNVTRTSIRVSPHELLSQAVETAVAKWKFRPWMKDGKPAPVVGEYEFTFNLLDPEAPLTKEEAAAPDAATVSRYVASLEGSEAFRSQYWKKNRHKAFAAAEEGSWGYVSNRSSPEQAIQGALERCERYRSANTRACRIVDIDGQWQPQADRTATPMRFLSPFEVLTYPRATVESWPDEKKAKALPLLDECRAEAESFVQLLRDKDEDAIYAAMAQEVRDQYSRADFEQSMVAMRKAAGVMTGATFGSQSLIMRNGDDDLRLPLATVIMYSVTTTTWKTPGLVMIISLAREAGKCHPTGFQYLALDALPPWLLGQQPERGT